MYLVVRARPGMMSGSQTDSVKSRLVADLIHLTLPLVVLETIAP